METGVIPQELHNDLIDIGLLVLSFGVNTDIRQRLFKLI
jgi:hypothetical protein